MKAVMERACGGGNTEVCGEESLGDDKIWGNAGVYGRW